MPRRAFLGLLGFFGVFGIFLGNVTDGEQKSTGRLKKSTGNYQPYQPKNIRCVDALTKEFTVLASHHPFTTLNPRRTNMPRPAPWEPLKET